MKAMISILLLITGLRLIFWIFESAEKSNGIDP